MSNHIQVLYKNPDTGGIACACVGFDDVDKLDAAVPPASVRKIRINHHQKHPDTGELEPTPRTTVFSGDRVYFLKRTPNALITRRYNPANEVPGQPEAADFRRFFDDGNQSPGNEPWPAGGNLSWEKVGAGANVQLIGYDSGASDFESLGAEADAFDLSQCTLL